MPSGTSGRISTPHTWAIVQIEFEPAAVWRGTHYEVPEVDECPAKLLGHTGEGIEREFDEEDETRVH